MRLDPRICAQARVTRDARFDGRFFIGVRSTRIYCRSICPVRTIKEQNVHYFPTAAAAAEAGYRPCLRCRPESSPGTPAWSGTSSTVGRALRLISEGALDNEGVETLAARLGIGSRQLRRLFQKHLGASPIAVMQTRRLHFAKKLIDETTLPFSQIALVAGYASVRRFNNEFRKTYNRTPTQIRKLAPQSFGKTPTVSEGGERSLGSKDQYLFHLSFRPPLDWKALLEFLAKRAIPGVEAITSDSYRRTIALDGCFGALRVSIAASGSTLRVEISFPEPRWLLHIIERVRRMFDLAADPNEIAAHLSADPLLAKRIAMAPGLRLPGCWDGFELAVRAILGQQISVTGASTLAGRLAKEFGQQINEAPPLTNVFPLPEALAEADVGRIGLPKARAETIRVLARAVSDGRISFDSLLDIEGFQSRLLEIPGIGDWTAQYIAMRALGDPDAFPASDLGLLRSLSMDSPRDVARRAEAWRPWRAYAAMYLWHDSSTRARIRNLTTQIRPRRTAAITV